MNYHGTSVWILGPVQRYLVGEDAQEGLPAVLLWRDRLTLSRAASLALQSRVEERSDFNRRLLKGIVSVPVETFARIRRRCPKIRHAVCKLSCPRLAPLRCERPTSLGYSRTERRKNCSGGRRLLPVTLQPLPRSQGSRTRALGSATAYRIRSDEGTDRTHSSRSRSRRRSSCR